MSARIDEYLGPPAQLYTTEEAEDLLELHGEVNEARVAVDRGRFLATTRALEAATAEAARLRDEQREGAAAVIAAQLVERAAQDRAAKMVAERDAARDKVERVIEGSAAREAELTAARATVTELATALESVWAAIGDRLLGRGPLSRAYANDVQREVTAALEKAKGGAS